MNRPQATPRRNSDDDTLFVLAIGAAATAAGGHWVVGNVAALTQSNLKRMLAYSSIAHAGYLLIGIVAAGAGYERGVTATLVYLFVYAFMQLGAFGIIILMRREDVIGDELKDLSGLYLRRPVAAFAMLLFMLSLGGIPPTAGFMGKFWLFSAAIEANYVGLALIGVLNSTTTRARATVPSDIQMKDGSR